MKNLNLKLVLIIGLAFFLYDFTTENIGFFVLFLLEVIVCDFFRKKNSLLYTLLFVDLILFGFLNFVMNTFMSFVIHLPQETLNKIYYGFSLPYYDFCMLYRVVVVQIIAFSYLTFGKPPNVKKTVLSVFVIFITQQLCIPIFSIEHLMIFFAGIGIINYTFYHYYKRKRQLSLALKKEILFLLYFIGFTLSLFEHISVLDIEYYSSTTYNYIIFLGVSYYVLIASESRLKAFLYDVKFKILLGVFVLFSLNFDKFFEYYLTQSSFLILIILVLMHLTKRVQIRV